MYLTWAMGFIIISFGQNGDVIRQKSKIDLHFYRNVFYQCKWAIRDISTGNNTLKKRERVCVRKNISLHSLCWWTTSFVVIGIVFFSLFTFSFESVFFSCARFEHNDDFTSSSLAAHDTTECVASQTKPSQHTHTV